jgi:DNA/RNA endonuclease YhcR with UshA esterase domain
MKPLVLAFGLALSPTAGVVGLAAPALAQTQTIAPADAKAHVGQTVTIEGPVGNVYTARSGMTFIDLGGRYPDNTFAAVIFADDSGKFPDVNALGGKVVDITGPVSLYRGKPEIILKSADQVKAK